MILQGDCLEALTTLDDASVHCCVTSPPYFGLRDYGTAAWEGGDPKCDHAIPIDRGDNAKHAPEVRTHPRQYAGPTCHKCGAKRIDSQIGLEETPEEYVDELVDVFRQVRRVLRDDGTLWLNLGDTYSNGTNTKKSFRRDRAPCNVPGRPLAGGLPPKNLLGIPWRVALALQADGWILREDVIWHKPNPMPSPAKDRCTRAHEFLFHMAKQPTYLHDYDAFQEPASGKSGGNCFGKQSQDASGSGAQSRRYERPEYKTRNRRSVWGIEDDKAFLAWVCENRPDVAKEFFVMGRNKGSVWPVAVGRFNGAHFATFPPDLIRPCILAGCPVGGTVLDPFFGAGTTGVVCMEEHRDYVGIELNPEYVELARDRLAKVQPGLPLSY